LSGVPDKRTHRGAHPEDAELFADAAAPVLRSAVGDLSWLLSRAYAEPSALKVVGDRYHLTARQRTAVMRSACTDAARASRAGRALPITDLAGRDILIDGYNVLTTIEAALGGGVILYARDETFRDMASIHGSYRKVEETIPALHLAGRTLREAGVARATWLLDQPVSNSGRLKGIMADVAQQSGWDWDVRIVADPDADLIAAGRDGGAIVASADSVILDRCGPWVNLAREIVARCVVDAWVVDLRGEADRGAGR
jgi:hypothetical protein